MWWHPRLHVLIGKEEDIKESEQLAFDHFSWSAGLQTFLIFLRLPFDQIRFQLARWCVSLLQASALTFRFLLSVELGQPRAC